MSALALVDSTVALAEALPIFDGERVRRARAATGERSMDYALGSGEADEVGLFAGWKPLLRQWLTDEALPGVRERLLSLGLAVVEAPHVVSTTGPATGRVLFVARDGRRAEAAARLEGTESHDLEMGLLLGYPRCCVEAYLSVPPPRRNLDVARRALDRTRLAAAPFAARLNVLDLAVFHYTSWLPCSFSCAPSRAYADAVASHIARRHGQFVGPRSAFGAPGPKAITACPPGCRHEIFVARCDEALGAHRLVLREDVQVSIAGRYADGAVEIERAWPTARDRHPAARLAPEATEAVARLVALVESAAIVSVAGAELELDGRAVVRTPDAMLLPFGECS